MGTLTGQLSKKLDGKKRWRRIGARLAFFLRACQGENGYGLWARGSALGGAGLVLAVVVLALSPAFAKKPSKPGNCRNYSTGQGR